MQIWSIDLHYTAGYKETALKYVYIMRLKTIKNCPQKQLDLFVFFFMIFSIVP